MRTVTALLLLVAVCAAATANATSPTGNSAEIPDKQPTSGSEPSYEGRDIGDTIENPFIIDVLPFADTGNTCPFMPNYEEMCPYGGYNAPDVVYRYYAAYTNWVDIYLCDSLYDTKVFVYENEHTPGNPYACNDDYCGSDSYKSFITCEFVEGNTYYIVVDGYSGQCGQYDLFVQDYWPCVWCPDGAVIEDEPDCIDPINDVWNGGCNSDPPVFQVLEPSDQTIWVCGTSGTYFVGRSNFRDTDWYEINLPCEMTITLDCIADFNLRFGLVDGREGCEGATSFYVYEDVPLCYSAHFTEILPAGTWWIWVGPSVFTGVLCGTEYMFSLDGYTATTPVEGTTWGTIKAMFR